ncbi:SapC family protein [Microbulbifer discodermiae]|uniref:SapC family protein n=1 Tax=Microbulbifer sp. 2201CG32-9 TaxID=3232309 RepID=UPI00345C189B
MARIKPLNKADHRELTLRLDPAFPHADKSHILPLTLHEVLQASRSYPVLFVKDSSTGQFNLVVLTGLRPGENLFAEMEDWGGAYIPRQVKDYPFVLIANPDNGEQALVCIDEEAPGFAEPGGERLFTDGGDQTEFLQNRSKALLETERRMRGTGHLIDLLIEKQLLTPRRLTVQLSGEEPYDLTGFYVIDESRLNDLPDADFLELRRKALLPVIYALVVSTGMVQSLIHHKENR